LYSINQIRKEAATMANSKSYDVSESYGLELQGVLAGALRYVEGGDATADVITEKLGTDLIQHKHIAGVKYQDICVEMSTGMANSIYDWIDATLRRTYQRKDGAIVTETSRLNFFNGLISEIGFPACDAGSKDSAKLTLKIAPDYTARASWKWSPRTGQQK